MNSQQGTFHRIYSSEREIIKMEKVEKHRRSDYMFLLNMSSVGIKKKTPNNFFTTSNWHLLANTMIHNPEEESLIVTIFTFNFYHNISEKVLKTNNELDTKLRHTSNTNSAFPLNEKMLQNNPKGNLVSGSQCTRSRNEHTKSDTTSLPLLVGGNANAYLKHGKLCIT